MIELCGHHFRMQVDTRAGFVDRAIVLAEVVLRKKVQVWCYCSPLPSLKDWNLAEITNKENEQPNPHPCRSSSPSRHPGKPCHSY